MNTPLREKKDSPLMWISITGLRLKKPWHIFSFLWFAIPSLMQAKRAPGNLYVATKMIRGVHHTLSAWASEKDLLAYTFRGTHRRAIGMFHRIAEGKTYRYQSHALPDWKEFRDIYDEKATPVAEKRNETLSASDNSARL